MAGGRDDITLSLEVEMRADKFRRSYEKTFKEMEKSAKRAQKEGQGAIGGFVDKMIDRFTKVPKAVKSAEKALKSYNEQIKVSKASYKQEQANYKDREKRLKQQIREFDRLSDAEKELHRGTIEESKKAVASYKKQADEALRSYDSIQKKAQELKDSVGNMKVEFSGVEMAKAAEEAGRELAEPLSSLLNKDIEGAGKSFAKLVGKGIGGIGGRVGKGIGKLGGNMTAKADAMAAAGKGGALAKSLGALGGLASKMGPMIQTLSKIGPLVGTLSGSIFALVKMFIDAEAQVKEFNKEILATSGSNQWFAKSAGNVEVGLADMDASLKNVRDAAYDAVNNLDWGISADTHKEVLSSLSAEGVQLTTLEKQFGQLNQKSAAFSKDFGSVTQAAVAYSRSMGVSLQEVTSFQAEMMTEMGQSLGRTVDSFRLISKSAEESGIASNKFYAMIRGVSSDLALYNTRLEDAVKLLGKLGKIMSPRSAQKFMQTAMNAYKGMSFQDKVKSSLLAGPAKTAKIVAEDIASKTKNLAKDIAAAGGGTEEEIKAALEKGPAGKDALKAMIAKTGGQAGTFNEAIAKLNLEKKRSKGGMVGNAAALSQVSAVGALEHKFAAATRFGKPGEGIGGELGGQLAGMSDEEVESAMIMKDAIDAQREELVKQGKMSAQEAKDASWSKIYDTMDQATKDAADGKDAQEEANKRMGTRVQSILDRLQVLIDWFMNTFYNVIIGIWDSITDITGIGNKDVAKAQVEAARTGNQELVKALAGKEGKGEAGKALSQTSAFKEVGKLLAPGKAGDAARMNADTLEMTAAHKTDEEKAAAKAQADKMREEAAADDKKQKYIRDQLDSKYTDDELQSKYGGDKEAARKDVLAGMSIEEQTKLLGDFTKAFPSAEMGDMAKKATEKGSIYTHDETVAKAVTDSMAAPSATVEPVEIAPTPGSPTPPSGDTATSSGAPPEVAIGGLDPTLMETGVEQQEAVIGTLGEIENALKNKGIKLNKSFMENQMAKMIEDATLNSLRTALFEFAMLVFSDKVKEWKDQFAEAGVTEGKGAMKVAGEWAGKHGEDYGFKANAAGGMVASVAGGLAKVSPAPGEGLTSIGKGERIVPAGGGGSSGTMRVELSLKGDLKQFVEATAQDVVVQHLAAAKNR